MTFNPGLNLESFAIRSESSAPPALNPIYLRDGKYDGMTRADVAASFSASRGQSATNRLALFFHGGLVDKARDHKTSCGVSSQGPRGEVNFWGPLSRNAPAV